MKKGILYGIPFLFAFVIITGVIVYLNSVCENIFEFNFSPRTKTQNSIDSTKVDLAGITDQSDEISSNNTNNKTVDDQNSSLSPVKSNNDLSKNLPNQISTDPIKKSTQQSPPETKDEIPKTTETKSDTVDKSQIPVSQIDENKKDPTDEKKEEEYAKWLKKVAAIYASLEPGKAAKIIQTYSDNVARDILYSMRKKTAAKIVAEFTPETAKRIFRFE